MKNGSKTKAFIKEAFSKSGVGNEVFQVASWAVDDDSPELVSAIVAYAAFHAKHFCQRDVWIASFPPEAHEPFRTRTAFNEVFDEKNVGWLMEELKGYEAFLDGPDAVSTVRLGTFLGTKEVRHLKPGPGAFLDAVMVKAGAVSGNRVG